MSRAIEHVQKVSFFLLTRFVCARLVFMHGDIHLSWFSAIQIQIDTIHVIAMSSQLGVCAPRYRCAGKYCSSFIIVSEPKLATATRERQKTRIRQTDDTMAWCARFGVVFRWIISLSITRYSINTSKNNIFSMAFNWNWQSIYTI